MVVKQLLCISGNGSCTLNALSGSFNGWDVHTVSTLSEATSALRAQRFLVGLLFYGTVKHFESELDAFLAAHADVRWVGLFDADALNVLTCRNLVIDHLHDFFTWPVDPDRLSHTLGHALGWATLRAHTKEESEVASGMHSLTGSSAAIVNLRAQIRKIAKVNAPVLICGESGSGKELSAQAIHTNSSRSHGPFVAINCGAMPATLIQAELFGYEKGASTGAAKEKKGLIETAEGGTIFFDEIADLPMDQQANLLRFLQEGTIYRVGATRSIKVNARVVAASHVNLQDAVAAGRFREDLFYRLNVLPINVPPLRERREDIADLARDFFVTYSADKSPLLRGFSSSAMAAIADHNWPGNVRELINRVRRAMVLAEGRLITPADLGLAAEAPVEQSDALDQTRVRAERMAICASLEGTRYNVTRAARELGVSRMTLYRLIAKHSIDLHP